MQDETTQTATEPTAEPSNVGQALQPQPEPEPVGKKPSEMRAAGFHLVRGAWRRG
jgi:hypothetical protein